MLQGIFALAPFALQVSRADGSKDVTAEMQA